METRIQFKTASFGPTWKAMLGLHSAVVASGLEPALLELVRVRVSQLNGCGFCLDMHTKDARAAGESEQRLYVLGAWREAPFYDERERAALAWAEAVTTLEHRQVSDGVYEQARRVFSEQELVSLTLAVVEINGWNRFNVAFRVPAGSYQPGQRPDLQKLQTQR